MNYRHQWHRMKQALSRGIEKNMRDIDNPLNHKATEYLEGQLRLRMTLLAVMHDIEKDQPLNTTFFNKKNIQVTIKKKK